jgi:hypothetical protein
MQTFTKIGLDALLTPENCAVLLIDHQPSRLADVNSHDLTGDQQRHGSRQDREAVAQILFDHAGASGTVLAWELANEAQHA